MVGVCDVKRILLKPVRCVTAKFGAQIEQQKTNVNKYRYVLSSRKHAYITLTPLNPTFI